MIHAIQIQIQSIVTTDEGIGYILREADRRQWGDDYRFVFETKYIRGVRNRAPKKLKPENIFKISRA